MRKYLLLLFLVGVGCKKVDTSYIAAVSFSDPKTHKTYSYKINTVLEQRPNYMKFLTNDGRTVIFDGGSVREE